MLEDDSGGVAYPTGQIQVRFATAPSEESRLEFARANGLRLVECNAYQPAQCTFEPLDRRVYLPDTVKMIESVEGVRRAWEVTESRYVRE